jgi:hypothetical protein
LNTPPDRKEKQKAVKTVDAEIEQALLKKGYKWNKMVLKSVWGYTYKYDVILDGKYVEQYNAKTKKFFE